jgi:hypothetical protein
MSALLLFVACAVLGGAPASANELGSQQDEERAAPTCRKCKSTGVLPCGEHPKDECKLEQGVLFCSVVADCEACGGTAQVDCHKCENEAAQEELENRRESFVSTGKRLAWVDDTWNAGRNSEPDKLRKVETEHFILVWEMEGMKVGRKRLNPHQAMHLYAERLEVLYADYLGALHARDYEFQKKSVVLIWYLVGDQEEASLRFCSNGARNGVKLMGSTPRYSVCANKQFFNSDEELHRNLVHNTTHLLLSHQRPSMWIGDKKYGWADEGLAHWFEDRYWQKCTNYCYQEQNTRVDFKSGRYKVAVRKMVATEKAPSVGEVFSRTTNDLTLPEHAVAFSYVDYLLETDGEKFNRMMALLRRKTPTRDALKECYGMNPLQFEAKWKAWVLDTYPTR